MLEPAVAFVNALGLRLAKMYPSINYGTQRSGSGSIMRIHRDVRFSPDKRPYKRNLGIVLWIGAGKKVELPCFYLNVEADHAFFYGGQHMFSRPVLERYRAAVDDDVTGTVLVKILQKLERKDLRVLEEPVYKRVPQGFPKNHARGELLRYGGIGVSADMPKETLTSADLLGVCADFASNTRPLIDWLNALNDYLRKGCWRSGRRPRFLEQSVSREAVCLPAPVCFSLNAVVPLALSRFVSSLPKPAPSGFPNVDLPLAHDPPEIRAVERDDAIRMYFQAGGCDEGVVHDSSGDALPGEVPYGLLHLPRSCVHRLDKRENAVLDQRPRGRGADARTDLQR